jgi:hypothetical protein
MHQFQYMARFLLVLEYKDKPTLFQILLEQLAATSSFSSAVAIVRIIKVQNKTSSQDSDYPKEKLFIYS